MAENGNIEWVSAITFTVHRCNIDQMEADHG